MSIPRDIRRWKAIRLTRSMRQDGIKHGIVMRFAPEGQGVPLAVEAF